MKKPQQTHHLDSDSTARQEPSTDPQQSARNGYPWETSTGEGAASALKSLRKMEQKRSHSQTPENRPGSD